MNKIAKLQPYILAFLRPNPFAINEAELKLMARAANISDHKTTVRPFATN